MKTLIIISLFILMASYAKAESDCSSIDLREQLGPARDQGVTMWCYAHSAADLVTQKIKKRVSAFDLATTYLLADERKILKSSDPEILAALKLDPGFFVRLKAWRLDEPAAYSAERFFTDHGLYYLGGYDQDAILLSSTKGFCPDQLLPGSDSFFKIYLKELHKSAIELCGASSPDSLDHCRAIPPKKMGEIYSDNSRALAMIFQQWVDHKCHFRIKPKTTITASSVDFAETLEEYNQKIKAGVLKRALVQKKLINEIDKNLESGKAVSIGYDLSDISPPDEFHLVTEVDHSSVVAARKKIGGACYYFVRTHLGNSCNYWPAIKNQCEEKEGGIWLNSAQLPSLYAVIHIN